MHFLQNDAGIFIRRVFWLYWLVHLAQYALWRQGVEMGIFGAFDKFCFADLVFVVIKAEVSNGVNNGENRHRW